MHTPLTQKDGGKVRKRQKWLRLQSGVNRRKGGRRGGGGGRGGRGVGGKRYRVSDRTCWTGVSIQ